MTSNILSRRKNAPFDSRIFPFVAFLKFIMRVRVLNHDWIIAFIELDAAPASVSSFKIYGTRLLSQRGIEGKSIQRKIQDT